MPAAPPVTTGSFQGVLHPADVARVLNLLVGGAPFCDAALTLYPTSRHAVAFPTAKPDRPQWLKEMDPIPVVGLGRRRRHRSDLQARLDRADVQRVRRRRLGEPDPGVQRPAARLGQRRIGQRGPATAATIPSLAGWWLPRLPAAGADLGRCGDRGDREHRRQRAVSPRTCAARPSRAGRCPQRTGQHRADGLPERVRRCVRPGRGRRAPSWLQPTSWSLTGRRSGWSRGMISRSTSASDCAFDRDALAVRIRGRFAVAAPDLGKGLRKINVVPAGTRGKAA